MRSVRRYARFCSQHTVSSGLCWRALFGFLLFALASSLSAQTVLREGWKVQSSAQVAATGDRVSDPDFSTNGWYTTSAPKTVFAVLVENGVYKNPYYGMNLRSVPGVEYKISGQFANIEMSDTSPFAVPWWYRKEFEVPAGEKSRQVWMEFRGINYRAEIWINGKKVAGPDEVVGAFRRYDFNVTQFVRIGEKNAVAVSVSAPKAGELGIPGLTGILRLPIKTWACGRRWCSRTAVLWLCAIPLLRRNWIYQRPS